MRDEKGIHRKPEGKLSLGRCKHKTEDNIKIVLKDI
jgi:hypothetical protein